MTMQSGKHQLRMVHGVYSKLGLQCVDYMIRFHTAISVCALTVALYVPISAVFQKQTHN